MHEEKALGIDMSKWNVITDWDLLSQVIDFVMIKCSQGGASDPKCLEHCKNANDRGIPIIIWHWDSPGIVSVTNANKALSMLDALRSMGINPVAVAVDVEEWWTDYTRVTKYTPAHLAGHAWSTIHLIQGKTVLPVMIYTRSTFVTEYAKPILDWIESIPQWTAYYPYASGEVYLDSWDKIPRPAKDLSNYYWVNPKMHNWTFWQISGDKFRLPGAGKIELDLFNGTKQDFQTWAKIAVTNPTEPFFTMEERVNILWEKAKEAQWKLF